MRIQIKGGIWKNTEDEILKAAVMKYGLNQWSRISSLLVRKSAKQCKARWYEWLDPAIKKTEWTREEDEKLLHLAKLLPTQWRTIAPIVGRTPAQCLERYEKLLDMAVGKDERYDPADDPRRLRPGEIDPNPESKPAKPDAVDMDEDEKEMLAEARARLANTRGKKAKRKAREKQLEEARRLATLQKRRELKAAGIEQRGRDKRKRGIDYSAEVAFERKPAPGFYDTGDEVATAKEMQQEFRPVTIEELEGRRRKDIEQALLKGDAKRQKLNEAHDTPAAMARIAEMNSTAVRRRGRMMLPAPQVSEAELEAIAKLGDAADLEAELAAAGAGGDATRQLLGTYAPTPARFATPMRTPRVGAGGAGGDSVMMAAQNLARLRELQTPLVGGDNPDLHPSDFSGITPRPVVAATPNPLAGAATPLAGGATPGLGRSGSGGMGATPLLGRSGSGSSAAAIAGVPATPGALALLGATPARVGVMPTPTPLRDQLGLNEMAEHAAASSKRALREQQAAVRSSLREALGQLPAPENEYQVAVPDLPEDEVDEVPLVEDAADRKARLRREDDARRAAEDALRSQALQRRLPRPAALDGLPVVAAAAEVPRMSLRERAEHELRVEMRRVLEHDAVTYPLDASSSSSKGGKAGKGAKGKQAAGGPQVMAPAGPPLERYELEELEVACNLLREEVGFVQRAMGHADVSGAELFDVWAAAHKDIVWLPAQGGYGRASAATPAERADALRVEFEGVRGEMEREARRAAKFDKKAGIVIGGLQQRDAKLQAQMLELWEQLGAARLELACFTALHEQEQRAAPERIERLAALCEEQRRREGALQERYKHLLDRRNDLAAELAVAGAVVAAS